MHNLTSVLHAWLRIGVLPAVVFLVVAWWRAPALGWPRQQPMHLMAAWFLLICVPVSGIPRIGEVDVVVLAAAAWVALGSGMTARRRALLVVSWVVFVGSFLHTCGTLVLTRIAGCPNDGYLVQAGMLLPVIAIGVLVATWPRQTIPQRMSMVALGALGVEYCRQVFGLWN
jgi:hypothetical protein